MHLNMKKFQKTVNFAEGKSQKWNITSRSKANLATVSLGLYSSISTKALNVKCLNLMSGPCLPRLLRPLLPRVGFEGLIRWKDSCLILT